MDTEIIREMLLAKIASPGKDGRPDPRLDLEIIRQAEAMLPPKDVFCLRMYMRGVARYMKAQPRTGC